MRIEFVLKPKRFSFFRKKDLGEYEKGVIRIFLYNFPRRNFLRTFVKVLNHEYAHYFISKFCKRKIKEKVEERVCELLE